ncbi:MAG: PEP-utilizing enzyme, partial [bacterium]
MDLAVKKIEERYAADLLRCSDKLKEFKNSKIQLDKNLSDKRKYLLRCQRSDVHELSRTITELSEYRTFFKLALSSLTFIFRDNFKKIASLAELPPAEFYNAYTIEDIKDLLINQKLLPISLVEQRNGYYVYIVKELKREIVSDLEYDIFLKERFFVDKKLYLVGVSACAGLVTGIAKVLSNSDIKNLKEESLKGKVLVTTMTDPSIMPFIRNCLAFVTDEGGLTSHAAIVSRELNIPCIVGTKNGTQMIEDGSLVEVDANSGVVKLLDSNNKEGESLKDEKLEISAKDYYYCGLWKSRLLASWYWAEWLVLEHANKVGLSLKDGGIFSINGGNIFVKNKVMKVVSKYVKDIVDKNNESRIALLKKVANNIYRQSLARAKLLSVKKPTVQNFKELVDIGCDIMFPWCLGYVASEVFDKTLIATAKVAGVKREDIFKIVPVIKTPMAGAQKSLRVIKKIMEQKGYWKFLLADANKAVIRIKKDKKVLSLIKTHSQEYGWLSVANLVGESPSLEQVIDQITHLSSNSNKHQVVKFRKSKKFSLMLNLTSVISYLR